MSGSVVNVLAPNGHRKNVKVQPNTALLMVLEEVCAKHKFDPNDYDLKHHKRILDLTTSYRFSGLPNNAQLEMVLAQKRRQDAEVELVIQLGDGTRLDGTFKPNATLLNIIQQLCPNELTGADLFAIYMRTEVPSDELKSTTLKDLGLISGRAIVRLDHRDPNAAKIQANVALNLQPKPLPLRDEESENKIRKTGESSALASTSVLQSAMQKLIDEKKAEHELSAEQCKSAQGSAEIERVFNKMDESVGYRLGSKSDSTKVEKMEVETTEPPSDANEHMEDDDDVGEIHILGERNAILFTQDAAAVSNLSDLPDTFFELNVNDIKLLIKDLRTQSEGTIDQPLLTSKLRELEEEQRQLSLLNRYKAVIIRIQFPDRYVLQGTFTPYETIGTITEFVRPYLANPDTDFHLYTTPPKGVLSKESRLFETNCIPSALLHFGSDDNQTNFLKEDILQKVSSPKASLMQALIDRGIDHRVSSDTSGSESQPSTSQHSRHPNVPSNFHASSMASTTSTKLPKWFKPSGI